MVIPTKRYFEFECKIGFWSKNCLCPADYTDYTHHYTHIFVPKCGGSLRLKLDVRSDHSKKLLAIHLSPSVFFFRLWDGIISCQSNQAGSACAVLCLFFWTNFEFQNNSGRILASCRLAKPTTKPAWTCKGVRHFGCIYYRSKFIQIPHKSSGTPSIFVLILQPCAKH